jgi:predicted RNA-binding protein Jag
MSEETAPPAAAAPALPPDPAKREQAVHVLGELLRLMDFSAQLEAKDDADGGISVALTPEGALPGVQSGRRSHVVDALQFIANKLVNRAGSEKRWISIGVGGHPEPRAPLDKRRNRRTGPGPGPGAVASAATPPVAQSPSPRPPSRTGPPAPRPPPAPAVDEEASVQSPEDPVLSSLSRTLAQKAASLGRFYAVAPMKVEDRARMLKAASTVPGVRVFVEGEGRNRRLVFAPDKPVPMPKRSALPQDDEELEG